jgi:hypothetical protein
MPRRKVRRHGDAPPALPAEQRYSRQSRRPLMCLLMLAPLLLFYEVGALLFNVNPQTHAPRHIIARNLLAVAFGYIGWTAYLLPMVLVLVILLIWHVVRRDNWRFEPPHLAAMFLESCAWSLPLLMIFILLDTYLPAAALRLQGGAAGGSMFGDIILSIGAGIYEELVFRLLLVGLASYLLVKMGMRRQAALVVTVLISAGLFSWYHYAGQEQFSLFTFVWRTVAGVYLGSLFAVRGFGIAAGAHAFWDIIVTIVTHARGV